MATRNKLGDRELANDKASFFAALAFWLSLF